MNDAISRNVAMSETTTPIRIQTPGTLIFAWLEAGAW